jgi:hypothetical protein
MSRRLQSSEHSSPAIDTTINTMEPTAKLPSLDHTQLTPPPPPQLFDKSITRHGITQTTQNKLKIELQSSRATSQ